MREVIDALDEQQDVIGKLEPILVDFLNNAKDLNVYRFKARPKKKTNNKKLVDYNQFMEWFHNGHKADTDKEACERKHKWLMKSVQYETAQFKKFLSAFPTMIDFTEFLNCCNSTEIALLRNEISRVLFTGKLKVKKDNKIVIPKNITYKSYLKRISYTEYGKRHLLYAMFDTYYNNLPTRVKGSFTIKGICGKHAKSKARKLRDEGTSNEWRHTIEYVTSVVSETIKRVNLYSRRNSTDRKEYKKMDILQSYGYKYLAKGLNGFNNKQALIRKVLRRSRRLDRIEFKTDQNLSMIGKYITKNCSYDIFDLPKGKYDDVKVCKQTDKQITRVQSLLKRKFYKDFTNAIKSKSDVMVTIGNKNRVMPLQDMAEQFVSDLKGLKL